MVAAAAVAAAAVVAELAVVGKHFVGAPVASCSGEPPDFEAVVVEGLPLLMPLVVVLVVDAHHWLRFQMAP